MIPAVVLTLAQTDTKLLWTSPLGVAHRTPTGLPKRTRMKSELSSLGTALPGLV
jgi:hypothetical protein